MTIKIKVFKWFKSFGGLREAIEHEPSSEIFFEISFLNNNFHSFLHSDDIFI